MSGECEKCHEHTTECTCLVFQIHAPEGMTFAECNICENPFVYDGTSENCLWCELNKEAE